MALFLMCSMVAGSFSGMGSATVHAATDALTTGVVSVEKTEDSYTIGNEYLSRTFAVEEGVLKTENIKNYRTDGEEPTVFVPMESSEEFVITVLETESKALAQEGWTAKADSVQATDADGPASNAIDDKVGTIWHTAYNANGAQHNNGTTSKIPYHFVLDMGKTTEFMSIGYTARSNGSNGRFHEVEIYLYNGEADDLAFDASDWGEPVKTVSLNNNSEEQYINFDTMQTATMILFKVNSSYGDTVNAWATAAEIDLYAEKMGGESVIQGFKASDLTVKNVSDKDVTATVNKVAKTGVELTVEFDDYTYNDVTYSIKEVITMYDGDSFMRKHLEISVPEEQASKAKIDYIDLENMDIEASNLVEGTYWTIPEQSNNPDMANMKGDYLELGQPYYLSAMYWGCEFPQTENKIREGNAFIRYHYGKTLEKDAHFEYHKNNTAGKMVTWDAVVGAARSTDYSVVQADFYEYIESIATDTDFRQQYNSWYDNMKEITKENLERSFFEIEKGFTQNGVNPLDSYVADDGWINYNSFWDFDESKFPNELYDASLQSEQMGSRFGLWLGPRGGYGTERTIAAWIANHGLGSQNPQSGNDINISDARYLNKLRDDIFISYQDKFDINYWKLDGMLLAPCTVESEYYTTTNAFATITETYERWTDMYEDMRDAKTDGDLWINMTSYTNPSPWHVQWVNSVWMQNTGDTGYNDSFGASDQQSMLTYRDNSYYNFLKERQWQLPNKYFYNHDPVYGLTANDAYNRPDIEYTTEELRDHLYMLGTRGTAFWEYYYSYSMFDDAKWDVNAEAARWIEDNFDILQKSQMIGGKPGNGDIYGFSCWNGSEGIVSLRNPKNVEQTYTLTFDRLIGVAEGTTDVYGKVIVGDISYQNDDAISYGESIEVVLPAKEVLIVQYGAKDTTPATIDSVHATDATTVEVEFDEAIRAPKAENFTVDGNTVTAVTLNADCRTAVLTLGNEIENAAAFTVNVSGVKDIVGNVTTAAATNEFYSNEKVAAVDNVAFDGSATVKKDAAASIDGKEGFTVLGKFSTTSEDATILEQKDAYKVSIENGYLVFELSNGLKVQSKYTEKTVNRSTGVVTSEEHGIISDGETHEFAAVKEINGMIKLYIDGKLVASAYDETKVNPVLAKGELVFGEGLTADTKYIAVLDTALAYDEVTSYEVIPSVPSEIIPADKITLTGSSVDTTEENVNKAVENAMDNNTNTFWATAADKTLADASLVLELDDVYKINRVDYTQRYDSGAKWGCTGNLLDYIIEVSVDGQTWEQAAAGDTVDGTTEIRFDAVDAKYVRLRATESYHWDTPKLNTVMTVAEISVYAVEEVTPECQHTNTKVVGAKEATCTEAGATGSEVCNDCGTTVKESETIPVKAHTEVTVAGREATCTETGLTEGKKCSVCDTVLKAQETIPATGHEFGEWTVVKAPTTEAAGLEERVCACGEKEQREIAKLPAVPEVVDKTEAQEYFDACEAYYAEADYTEESWAAYELAMAALEEALADEDVTAKELQDAVDAVEAAAEELVKAETPEQPVEPEKPGTDDKEDNKDEDKEEDKSPATGDTAMVVPMAVLMMACAAIVVILRRRLAK